VASIPPDQYAALLLRLLVEATIVGMVLRILGRL
jgi:hypothetical protein